MPKVRPGPTAPVKKPALAPVQKVARFLLSTGAGNLAGLCCCVEQNVCKFLCKLCKGVSVDMFSIYVVSCRNRHLKLLKADIIFW